MRTCPVLLFPYAAVFLLQGLTPAARANPGDPVPAVPDYVKDIRPILADHCFSCHGVDEKARKARLRLDDRDAALAAGAFKPGDVEGSELYQRLLNHDPEEIMPPPDSKKPLKPDQIELLRRWVAGGAPYARHWAFEPPVKAPVPVLPEGAPDQRRSEDPVDAFLAAQLHKEGLQFAPEASREVWLRRATFDLTGLPPSLAEQDAFLADEAPDAFEKAVDRLLASPAYGERMASDWLDAARYGDTYGRHEDADCATWPYRDWVIQAFNQNLSWDQFITWQTAGDLLPAPTRDQMIATCFNRLPQQSNEAGSNPDEFRIEQVADRVRTNGLAFMGMTTECARCHDHKFDPISTKEYYSLAAFFNNIDELGLFCVYTGGTPPPSILLFTPDAEIKHTAAKAEIARLEKALAEGRPAAGIRFKTWLASNRPPRGEPWVTAHASKSGTPVLAGGPAAAPGPRGPESWYPFESLEERVLQDSVQPKVPGKTRINATLGEGRVGQSLIITSENSASMMGVPELHRHDAFSYALWVNPGKPSTRAVLAHRSRAGIDAASRGVELILEDGHPVFALCHFSPGNEIRIRGNQSVPVNAWTHLAVTYDGSSRTDGMALYLNGEKVETSVIRDGLYRDIVYRADWGDDTSKDDGHLAFALGGRTNDASYTDGRVDEFQFFKCQLTAPEVRQISLKVDTSTPADWLEWYLREIDSETRVLSEQLTAARALENELSGQAVDLMVMKEWSGPRRPSHVLARGQFDQPADPVEPGVPAAILPFDDTLPRNRLGFAQWLTDRKHPLTSRVAVNRFWQLIFNRGLVPTSEDFGTQGRPPSHPELLDWLAVDFMEKGWDVKALCRRLVLSTAYRQSSIPATAAALERDPENRLLSRGPRVRLPGEALRDMALAASGLLVSKTGGPSVYPYQPAGLWEESGTQHTYQQGKGADLYRRSLYSFWRRTLPPPTLTVFDAPTREFCKVRRERTNTPLQALVLMNDPQFIEAARILAENLVRQYPADDSARARDAFRLLTSARPDPGQLAALTDYLAKERPLVTPAEAKTLLSKNGERTADASLDPIEVTATTHLIRLLFGFTETTMKP